MSQRAGQPAGWNKDKLNRMNPASSEAQLGTRVDALINTVNALLVKLDADAGASDADYAATLAQPRLDEPAS